MKLLLTSNGFTNKIIENKLGEMVGKDFSELKAVFIPTAMNVQPGDKSWFVDNLNNAHKLGFGEFEIVEISALQKDFWLPKLEAADVVICNGGSNFHLIRSIERSGLLEELPKLLQTRVWVGSSAGGMIMAPFQSTLISQEIYEEDFSEKENVKSVGFVDFHIVPHLNGEGFSKLNEENLKVILKDFKDKVYVIDDNTGIAVVDGKAEVVGGGDYFILN